MRTKFKSIELPKRLARAIVHVFPALKLSTGQEWAAQICGYRNWHDLNSSTRHFTGKPTPDPFFAEHLALEQAFDADDGDGSVEGEVTRIRYQMEVLDGLIESLSTRFEGFWPPYWDIMHLAHAGLPSNRVHFGSGSPLFMALQFPWFKLEDEGKTIFEDGDLIVSGSEESVSLRNGFVSLKQADRWLRGAAKLSAAELSEIKSEFPGIAPRVAGGSVIRVHRNEEGRPLIVQSTRHRYWWRRTLDGRMIGGFSVTFKVISRQNDSSADEYQFCVHDAWNALPVDFHTLVIPSADATADVFRFLETRIGLAPLSGTVTFAYDDRPGSKAIAATLRDLVFDGCKDRTDMDLSKIFRSEIIPYRPKYLQQQFRVLESEVV